MLNHPLWRVVALVFLVPVFLGACSTLSRETCEARDWYQVGFQDGEQGYRAERLSDHQKACREYGIDIVSGSYHRGRKEGLTLFCTPENAYEYGRSGQHYQGVCPPRHQKAFLKAYRAGKRVHELETSLKSLEWKIKDIERKLDHDVMTDQRRRELHIELNGLLREQHALLRALNAVEASRY